MPFRSEKQKRFLFARHPEIAQRWAEQYGAKPKRKVPSDKRQKLIKGYLNGR